MPTREQMEVSDLDLIVAGSEKSVLMIEGFGDQLPEQEMGDAIMFAHKHVKTLIEFQSAFKKKAGIEEFSYEEPEANPFVESLRSEIFSKLKSAKQNLKKCERGEQTAAIKQEALDRLFPDDAVEDSEGRTRAQAKEALYILERDAVRELILKEGVRLDGRKKGDLRALDCSVGTLPSVVHGSALFTRGETQSLATVALGTTRDKQRADGLFGETSSRFMLHYYFPSYSVGEVRPIRGPGRREIGHGCLAERSVLPVIPREEKFPYTIRVISDITESNGSSSMASVCAATMSLMDAGVPIMQPVAGISIGLVQEGDDYVLLTDIMGAEDHFGDMDFKVAGTGRGVTGIQLDLKNEGINEKVIRDTLTQAKEARVVLLRTMLESLKRPRKQVSPHAPKLTQTKIDPEKIGLLIGPGGKTVRAIQEETGATVDIAEDGTVTVSAADATGADAALARIEALTEEIKVGRIYAGKVSSIKDFGAFIEIAPGKDGLCHISELSDGFVKSVADICKVGDEMEVKVIAVDDQNRVKLSRRAVLAEQNGDGEAAEEYSDD